MTPTRRCRPRPSSCYGTQVNTTPCTERVSPVCVHGRCRCPVAEHTAAAQAYADQERNVVICSPFYLNQLLPGDILERDITPADLLVDRWRGVHTVDITAGLSATEKLKVLGEYSRL